MTIRGLIILRHGSNIRTGYYFCRGCLSPLFELGNIDSIRVIDTCFDIDNATRYSLFTG